MSVGYKAVGWNRQKRIYNVTLVGGVGMYLIMFIVLGATLGKGVSAETLLIRALGTAALLLLHIILSIGPLCRLDPRFLPLLYNRRHMGVTMFIFGAAHGVFALVQFHGLGNLNPFVSVLVSNSHYGSISDFPFQPLGLAALIIFFLMAATSHDFWLTNLTAPIWKFLHMLVYVAYTLIIGHVVLGVLQAETSPVLTFILGAGLLWVIGLHMTAALRERLNDNDMADSKDKSVDVCAIDEIPNGKARIFTLTGDRVAVFRYDGKISAISNVCQHQNGPLGEGCVIDGLITCPWHGYQYAPDSGESPPPFNERVPTFNVKIIGTRVFVDPNPNEPGTRAEPARIEE